MSHSISTKIRDFFSSFNENMAYASNANSPVNADSKKETVKWSVNPYDYSDGEEHLRWDEYGNPYIAD